jgi:hypothetical protein
MGRRPIGDRAITGAERQRRRRERMRREKIEEAVSPRRWSLYWQVIGDEITIALPGTRYRVVYHQPAGSHQLEACKRKSTRAGQDRVGPSGKPIPLSKGIETDRKASPKATATPRADHTRTKTSRAARKECADGTTTSFSAR